MMGYTRCVPGVDFLFEQNNLMRIFFFFFLPLRFQGLWFSFGRWFFLFLVFVICGLIVANSNLETTGCGSFSDSLSDAGLTAGKHADLLFVNFKYENS